MAANTERVDIVVTERDVLDGDEATAAKPDGPLAAVLLAAGIGAFALGLFTTLAEASAAFRERLVLNEAWVRCPARPSGPPSSSSSPGSCSTSCGASATGCCARPPLPLSC